MVLVVVVVHPGLLSTVQDRGRPGRRAWGVPISGAFDRDAHDLANALVGNAGDAATVELTLVGGTYRAETPLAIALAGAPMEARILGIDGSRRRLRVPQSATLWPGEHLVLGGSARGVRAYLAAKGGWRTPLVMGSRSSESGLRAGDRLPAVAATTPVRRPGFALRDVNDQEAPIRILAGPDAEGLDLCAWERLTFRVSPRSDRMGLRLEGPAVDVPVEADRVSIPVAPGGVQVAGGSLIVLGPACGTMGGYPLVAHVLSADLARLGQARPGQAIRFRLVPMAEARRIDRDDRQRRAAWFLRTATLAAD